MASAMITTQIGVTFSVVQRWSRPQISGDHEIVQAQSVGAKNEACGFMRHYYVPRRVDYRIGLVSWK